MKIAAIIVAVAACAFADGENLKAPLFNVDTPTAIEGEYIVVFKREMQDDDLLEHKQIVRNMMSFYGNSSAMQFEYNIGVGGPKSFRGYAAKLDDKLLDMVRGMRHVRYVERNMEAHAFQADCVNELVEPWGLVRTTLVDWPPSQYDYSYAEDAAGEDVDAYVIDTGIDLTHPEFEGRAKFGTDTVDNPPRDDDPNGHGTHVAGTIMSKSYGLAKKATAIAVRVLNAGGSGSFAGVIAGVDWSANDHKEAGPTKKSVANMSLGGGFNSAVNEAVNAAIDDGVHFAIAAGNSNNDACTLSPASSESITVAASDKNDLKATFSSYGTCVEIIAPGVAVLSTTPNGGVAEYSGTSMAAPHIAGVAAKYLSTQPADIKQDDLLKWFEETGTKDKVVGFPANPPTPNLLPFMECK